MTEFIVFIKIYLSALPNHRLSVQFCEGVTKLYDMSKVFDKLPCFDVLKSQPELFCSVEVDVGGYGIVWNVDLDLSCDELWENGEVVDTPFDGFMSSADAKVLFVRLLLMGSW